MFFRKVLKSIIAQITLQIVTKTAFAIALKYGIQTILLVLLKIVTGIYAPRLESSGLFKPYLSLFKSDAKGKEIRTVSIFHK